MPNFTGVERNYAIVELVDATQSTNKQIVENVAKLHQSGITEFIFDFKGVEKFTSTSLGLMIGIVQVAKVSNFRTYTMRLSYVVREMLELSLSLGQPELRFDGLTIQELTLRGVNG